MLIGDFSVFAVCTLSVLLVCIVWYFLNGFFKQAESTEKKEEKHMVLISSLCDKDWFLWGITIAN